MLLPLPSSTHFFARLKAAATFLSTGDSLNEIYQEKYSQMTDSELNRALTNAKNQMNKEQAKVLHEQQKLQKMVDEFKKMKDTDPGVDEKWNAIDKQTGVHNFKCKGSLYGRTGGYAHD